MNSPDQINNIKNTFDKRAIKYGSDIKSLWTGKILKDKYVFLINWIKIWDDPIASQIL